MWSLESAGDSEVPCCQRTEVYSHGSSSKQLDATGRLPAGSSHGVRGSTQQQRELEPSLGLIFLREEGREVDAKIRKRNWPRVKRWLPGGQVSVCTQLALFNTKGTILWDSLWLIGLVQHGRNVVHMEIPGSSGRRHKPRPRLSDGPALSFPMCS